MIEIDDLAVFVLLVMAVALAFHLARRIFNTRPTTPQTTEPPHHPPPTTPQSPPQSTTEAL